MKFFKFLRVLGNKGSSDQREHKRPARTVSDNKDLLHFDLLYQLAYMSALATAGMPRTTVIEEGAKLESTVAHYFDQAGQISRGMNYDFSEACRIVGERAKVSETRSLFFRLSSSAAAGESIGQFMDEEFTNQAASYVNLYDRQIESVRKWTDAYSSLMVSSALIVVVAAISTMIYDLGSVFVTGLVTVTVSISTLGAWIIYRSAPHEMKTVGHAIGAPSQRFHRKLLWMLGGLSVLAGGLVVMSGHSTGFAMIAVTLLMLPLGIAGMRFDSKVDQRDSELGTFFRILGTTASSIGTTPGDALGRIDLRSLPMLSPAIKRLRTGLRARTAVDAVWNRFVTDTGSELARRSARIFADGIRAGGDPAEVGERTSSLSAQTNFLRAKR